MVQRLLRRAPGRLLTLTGPGGVGKTRLALHIAEQTTRDFPDGTVWVDLGSLVSADLVLPAIAGALGIREGVNRNLRETIVSHLADKRCLLVLDNFEHLLDAATEMSDLLLHCPGVSMLITSRAALNLRMEQEYVVPPLELPTNEVTLNIDHVLDAPSVQLFVWHATQRDPHFTVDEGNAAEIAAICRRLDGVPLALELATARLKVLGVRELRIRLHHALGVLTGGSRDLPERQRTMESAIRWSYELLSPAEQCLFRRLSVFVGGWTLDAAETVIGSLEGGDTDTFSGIATLVDQSLVRQSDDPCGDRRSTMLETFREFGTRQLEHAGETIEVQQAFLQWCLTLAESSESRLAGPEQTSWLARLEMEHDNLRGALALSDDRFRESQLRLAGALWRFWWWHGHLFEGRTWLTQLLMTQPPVPSPWRAKALVSAGILAREQGDLTQAWDYLEESLTIRRTIGDAVGSAQCLNNLGLVASSQGDFTRALALLQEALALYREAGDGLGEGNVLNNLGIVAREQGAFDQAAALYTESMELLRAFGEQRGVANTLHNLGRIARDMGELERAVPLYEESIAIERALGDRLNMAMSLSHLGTVARDKGDYQRAIELYGESLQIRHDFGDKLGCIKSVEDVAALAILMGHPERGLYLYASTSTLRESLGAPIPPADQNRIARLRAQAQAALTDDGGARCLDDRMRASLEGVVRDAFAFLDKAANSGNQHPAPRLP